VGKAECYAAGGDQSEAEGERLAGSVLRRSECGERRSRRCRRAIRGWIRAVTRQQKDGAEPRAIDAGGNRHQAQGRGKGARRDVRVHDKERVLRREG